MKVPEDAPRTGRKRRIPARSGPEAPVPLWDPPSGLDPMGRVELQGHFVRGLARRIRDPRTPRHVRFALRVVTAVLFLSFVVPLTLVVVDIVLRF